MSPALRIDVNIMMLGKCGLAIVHVIRCNRRSYINPFAVAGRAFQFAILDLEKLFGQDI